MIRQDIPPLNWKTPIVDPQTGMPTTQFIRLWQQLFGNSDKVFNDLTGKIDETRQILPGTGLSGGGDLSADRTLGLANTAVIPGSYTNTNVTVNAQGQITQASTGSGGGGGGSGVPEGALSPPSLAQYATQRIIPGATITSPGAFVRLSSPSTNANQNSLVYAVRAIPANATEFTWTIRIRRNGIMSAFATAGLILRDSVSGKSQLAVLGSSTTGVFGVFTNNFVDDNTAISANTIGPWQQQFIWLRVKQNAVDRQYFLSVDGIYYVPFLSLAPNDFVVPDQFGFALNPNMGDNSSFSNRLDITADFHSALFESLP